MKTSLPLSRRVLIMHAHPDDEVITTGGVIAKCISSDINVMLVTCTDGRYGPINPDLNLSSSPSELAKLRKDELKGSMKILGIKKAVQLNYHDSGMTGSKYNHSVEAFMSQNLEGLITQIKKILLEFRPHIVITYDSFGCTGHPDHIQAHRVTLLAIEAAAEPINVDWWQVSQLFYPIYPVSALQQFIDQELLIGKKHPFAGRAATQMNYTRPNHLVTHQVDISKFYSKKKQALLAHKTQIGSHNPHLYLSALARTQHEHFRQVYDKKLGPDFSDIFEEVTLK